MSGARCVVKSKDAFCNIEADRMREEEDFIYVYRGVELVGCFDIGSLEQIWLSEKSTK